MCCSGEGVATGDGKLRGHRAGQPVPVDVRHGETEVQQGAREGRPHEGDGESCQVSQQAGEHRCFKTQQLCVFQTQCV